MDTSPIPSIELLIIRPTDPGYCDPANYASPEELDRMRAEYLIDLARAMAGPSIN